VQGVVIRQIPVVDRLACDLGQVVLLIGGLGQVVLLIGGLGQVVLLIGDLCH
jgi:hypothetical protein